MTQENQNLKLNFSLEAIPDEYIRSMVETCIREAQSKIEPTLQNHIEIICTAIAPPPPISHDPKIDNTYYPINFSAISNPALKQGISIDHTDLNNIREKKFETNTNERQAFVKRLLGNLDSVIKNHPYQDPRGIRICRCGECIDPDGSATLSRKDSVTLINSGQKRSSYLSRYFKTADSVLFKGKSEYVISSIDEQRGVVNLIETGNGFLNSSQTTLCRLKKINKN